MHMIGWGVSMVTEILKQIDTQIAECYRELSYLYSFQGDSDQGLDALFSRLQAIRLNGDIYNSDVINSTCIAFFDDDDAYTVNRSEMCIDIKQKVVGYNGVHTECERCFVGFYQNDGKFGNKQHRLPQMSFFEHGQYDHHLFKNIHELMMLLCQNFLEENQFKVPFIERVRGLSG